MKKNYFTSKHSKGKSLPFKQSVLTLLLMLSVTFSYAQLRIETVSSHSAWDLQYANSGGPLTWIATGAVVDTQIGTSTVSFDFSANTSNANIVVESTANQGALNKITIFIANQTKPLPTTPVSFEGQSISFIDVSDLQKLQTLILDYNNLTSIDVTQNGDLVNLSLVNNAGITSLDVSQNTKLKDLRLEGTSLTSAEIDNILNTVQSTSTVNGGFIDFSNITTGNITENGIQAYINLTARGWVIFPPQGFDLGDAPDSYSTSITNNGPFHFYDELNTVLRLGVFKDNDLKSTLILGPLADGDDNDNVNDEDGVDISQFDNFYNTATSLSIEVLLDNTYGLDSYLHAWIDFDLNGTFDADEYATIVVPANTSGIQTLNWDITGLGADVNIGQSYARFRYTSDNDLDATSFGGLANGGEVEDYTFEILDGLDTDNDGVPNLVDVDDDNDGILDTVEDLGPNGGDSNNDGIPDRISLDADGDTCYDVTEAGFIDDDNDGMLGSSPVSVELDGAVTGHDYTVLPNDLDNNGVYDFQEAGEAASITSDPVNQDFALGGSATFTATAIADTYQWEVSVNGGAWADVVDNANNSGATTNTLTVSNLTTADSYNMYRLRAEYVSFACDTTPAASEAAGFNMILLPATTVDVSCNGLNDGSIDITVLGGVLPYTYLWTTTDGSGLDPAAEDQTGLTVGTYDVTITDANGASVTGTYTLTEPDAIVLTETITDVTIAGGADGAIALAVTGGTAPYTYAWTTVGGSGLVPTDKDQTGLTSGTYEVTVTDANGCAEIASYVVNQPGPLTLTLVSLTDLICNGDNNGAIEVTVTGGVTPYQYLWSNGATTEDLTAISGGTYTLTVTDANGATVEDTFEVKEPSAIVLTASITDVTINGATDGAIDLTISGGTGAYTIQWTNGESTEDISGLSAGTYSVTVTDENGCMKEATYEVSEPEALAVTGVISNVTCNGLSDGAIDITVTGGVPPFTYLWSNGAVTEDVSGLVVGTYSVEVTDANGSVLNTSFDVTEPEVLVITDVTSTDPSCPLLNDGSITVTASGTDLEYSVDNGVSFQDANIFNGLVPGAYDIVVRVKSSTSCSATYDSQIVLNTIPCLIELTVIKTQTGGPNPVTDIDQTLDYTITLENTGEVNITNINIVDLLPDGTEGILNGPTGDIGVIGEIEMGEMWTYTISYTTSIDDFVVPVDLVNTVMVTSDEITDPEMDTAVTPIDVPDTDNDGVVDLIDVDDDNDGIEDTVEGEFTDSNLDGIPDRISLDADGDGCSDVTEAGFTDENGSGTLGGSPVVVDAEGRVTSGTDGYTTPNDLDGNGVYDFQEAGTASVINNQPVDATIALGADAVFEVSGNASFYQWEISMDNGSTWSPLNNDEIYSGVNTDRLTVSEARGRLEGTMYRVLLTSPDFACDPNPELYSEAVRLIFNTELIPNGFSPNDDSQNDVFSIPGLIETPNFTIEVFDRWGNSVYKYANNGNLSPLWWDGKSTGNMTLSKGELVPAGTYFYLINFNDGNKSPRKGWVYVNY